MESTEFTFLLGTLHGALEGEQPYKWFPDSKDELDRIREELKCIHKSFYKVEFDK